MTQYKLMIQVMGTTAEIGRWSTQEEAREAFRQQTGRGVSETDLRIVEVKS